MATNRRGIGLADLEPRPSEITRRPEPAPSTSPPSLPATTTAEPARPVLTPQQPVEPRQRTEGERLGIPQFQDSPLAAIGHVLGSLGAGLTGQELPATRLKRERLQRQTLELQQIQIGAQTLEQGLSLLERTPPEDRQQTAERFSAQFADTLPGLRENLLQMAGNLPNAREVAQVAGEFAPQLYALCGGDVECIRERAGDTGLVTMWQAQRDRQNLPGIGAKLRDVSQVLATNPSIKGGLPNDLLGNAVMTFEDILAMNEGLPEGRQLSDSEIATIRRNPNVLMSFGIVTPDMAEFMTKERFKSRMRIAEEAADPGAPSSDLLDESGNVKNEVSADLFRRAASLQGAQVDPRTGLMANLTPAMARNSQEIALTASSLLRQRRARSVDEAISMAVEGTSALPPIDEPDIPISPEKRADLLDQQAEIARILPIVEGNVEAARGVGFYSNVGSAINSVAQLFMTTAFDDNEANRQNLREMNNDLKRAFANNPRFTEGEQKRILQMLPNPDDWFKNPETAQDNMRSLIGFLGELQAANEALLEGERPGEGAAQVQTQEDYDALPSGALYDVGDGVVRKKQ